MFVWFVPDANPLKGLGNLTYYSTNDDDPYITLKTDVCISQLPIHFSIPVPKINIKTVGLLWYKKIYKMCPLWFIYSEASLIRAALIRIIHFNIQIHVWEPIIIKYVGSYSFIRIFSYLDSQLGNRGVRITEVNSHYFNVLYSICYLKLNLH